MTGGYSFDLSEKSHFRPAIRGGSRLGRSVCAWTTARREIRSKPKKRKFWRKPFILQASRVQDGLPTFVDFYLYNDKPKMRLIQRWNFTGLWRDPETTIHVPKSLIFPSKRLKCTVSPCAFPPRQKRFAPFFMARPGGRQRAKEQDTR